MLFDFEGREVFASTGGRAGDPAEPLILFLHGAGMDHSVWALQSRWFAHHGHRVLALDLPGHGGSQGPPIADIGALCDWTAGVIAGPGGGKAAIVGHSMGALIALATAARHPERVSGIALVGVGARMPVSAELLAAAKSGDHASVDMVALWGLGPHATRGGSPSPGLWMLGGTERLLERAPPGALYADLAACDTYSQAEADAARVACPALLVLGERDMMSPLKSGQALAKLIPGARATVIPGAGHMMTVERADETLEALRALKW